MGIEKRTKSETVTKKKQVKVEVEDVEEQEVEVFVCDLCGQEDGPEYDDEFHQVADPPKITHIEEGKEPDGVEMKNGGRLPQDKYSLYDRKAVVADQVSILCPHCYRNLFGKLTESQESN